ncbi:MAG: hypothetical protein DWI59_06125 [Chloroflexi bacterium]|nr:MAG: hypothetical protein DWI59_06125 [Chloroflexota bacterium]
MVAEFDPYEALEVSRQASQEVIKAAYRRLARRFHPDSGDAPDAARMVQLNRAQALIGTPAARIRFESTAGAVRHSAAPRRPAAAASEPPPRRSPPPRARTAGMDGPPPAQPQASSETASIRQQGAQSSRQARPPATRPSEPRQPATPESGRPTPFPADSLPHQPRADTREAAKQGADAELPGRAPGQRRNDYRFPVSFPVRVALTRDERAERVVQANALDLSTTGLMALAPADWIASETPVKLSFEFVGVPYLLAATATRVRGDGYAPSREVGFMFDGIDRATHERLRLAIHHAQLQALRNRGGHRGRHLP